MLVAPATLYPSAFYPAFGAVRKEAAVTKRRNGIRAKIGRWLTPVRLVGLAVGLFGAAVALFGHFYRSGFAAGAMQAFYANVATECVSIAVTVIIIDWLYERRDTQREKERLVREMRNRDNGLAIHAVEELRANDWLGSGLLVGKHLWDANLEGANLAGVNMYRVYLNRANLQGANLDMADLEAAHLEKANLRGAHLGRARLERADLRDSCLQAAHLIKANLREAHLLGADLQGADLEGTDLQGAEVHDAQLIKASRLRGVTMPDGSRYDGRFNLQGDLKTAYREQVDVTDAAAVAAFLGVTIEDYQRGQAWAQGNLSILHSEGL